MMLVTTFSLSEEEVECPELRCEGYSTTLCTTYVTDVRYRAFSHKRLRQQVSPKRLYTPTRQQGVTAQKRAI
jgi:hypothetical protein